MISYLALKSGNDKKYDKYNQVIQWRYTMNRVTTKQLIDKIEFINSRMDKKELVLMQSYGYNHIGIRDKTGHGGGIDRQLDGGMTKRECMNWLRAFHYGREEY